MRAFLNLFCLLAASLVLPSCFLIPNTHDKLRLEKTEYLGDLRLDGFYHQTNSEYGRRIYVLYRNGAVRVSGAEAGRTLDEIAASLSASASRVAHIRYNWGLFEVKGDTMVIEVWRPGSDVVHTPAFRYTGPVLSDTTFMTTQSEPVGGGDVRFYDSSFQFFPMEAKPDSTNDFL